MQDDVVARLADRGLEIVEQLGIDRQQLGDAGEHPAHDRQGLRPALEFKPTMGDSVVTSLSPVPARRVAVKRAGTRRAARVRGSDSAVSQLREPRERPRRIRETCICETPTRSAIWVCVRSSDEPQHQHLALALRQLPRGRADGQPVVGQTEPAVLGAERSSTSAAASPSPSSCGASSDEA